MISRRAIFLGVASPAVLRVLPTRAQEESEEFVQLTYPEIEALDRPELFGYRPATQAQIARAAQIVAETPKGPTPFHIAKSFVDRFYTSDPEAISQWPAPSNWNPLIKDFFASTTLRATNDMVAWCAAFSNWCIERNQKNGSKSAASQSYLDERNFKRTDDPEIGDLAIWTCYDKASGRSTGLGHVGFVSGNPANGMVPTIGGNVASNGHSSIIADKTIPIGDRDVRRNVGGRYVLTTMRLNTYVKSP